MDDLKTSIYNIGITIIICLVLLLLIIGLCTLISYFKSSKIVDSTSPVEESTQIIDSLNNVNSTIKLTITKLDSLKNDEVNKVATFDNDSTLKLFYELIK